MLEVLPNFKLKPRHTLLMNIPPNHHTYGSYPIPGEVIDINDTKENYTHVANNVLHNSLICGKLFGFLCGVSPNLSERHTLSSFFKTTPFENEYQYVYYSIMVKHSDISEDIFPECENLTKSLVEYTKGVIVAISDSPFEISEFISNYAPQATLGTRIFKADIDSSHCIQKSGINGILIATNFAKQTSDDHSIQYFNHNNTQNSKNKCIQIAKNNTNQISENCCIQLGKRFVKQSTRNETLQYAYDDSSQVARLDCTQMIHNRSHSSQECLGGGMQIGYNSSYMNQIAGDGTFQSADRNSTQRARDSSLQDCDNNGLQYSEEFSIQICSNDSSQFTKSKSIQIASNFYNDTLSGCITQVGKDDCRQIGGINVLQIAGDNSIQEGKYGAIQCAGENSIQMTCGGCSFQKSGLGSIQIYTDTPQKIKYYNNINNENANQWLCVKNGVWRACNKFELEMLERKYNIAMKNYEEEKEKFNKDFEIISKK